MPRPPIHLLAPLNDYPELVQGCTTRHRPVGPWGPAGDWNLKRRGLDPAVAEANWQAFEAVVGVSCSHMVGPQQIHGVEVQAVDDGDTIGGEGTRTGTVQGADALVTATPGVLLLIGAADCVPVYVYDPVQRAVGLAHAGWKGTAGRIAEKTVRLMAEHYGTDPAQCVAALGPGIGPCCYEVGVDVVEDIRDAYPEADEEWHGEPPLIVWSRRRPRWKDQQGLPSHDAESDETPFLDLWNANRRALIEAGLRPENVWIDGLCTAENVDRFYSHRAERGLAGRMMAFLGVFDNAESAAAK